MLVATTGGYALSVLRPRYGPVLYGLVLATLFVPAVVLLVPLYLTVLDPPLLRTSPGQHVLGRRGSRPARARSTCCWSSGSSTTCRARCFEAARVDGAGPFRLFWSIVLPMSRPILGVVSVFAVMAAWKDFLWPLLVLRDPDMQPLSVRLPVDWPASTELDVLLAALAISTLIPIVLFLVFQRMFLRGAGLEGAVKG